MIMHQELVDIVRDASADQDAVQLQEILNTYFRVDDMPSPLRPFAPHIRLQERRVTVGGGDAAEQGLDFANAIFLAIRYIQYRDRVAAGRGRLRIIAQGDSWFQYALRRRDIIDHLGRHHAILSLGGGSDTIERMLRRKDYLEPIREEQPDVFLMSVGGNDLFGARALAPILLPFTPGMDPEDLIDRDGLSEHLGIIMAHFRDIVANVVVADADVVIAAHGYDYSWPKAGGSWLGALLNQAGIPLDIGRKVVGLIIDEFNDGLSHLQTDLFAGRFRHVDLRGHVDRGAVSWFDELHPMDDGYARAANRFEDVLADVAPREGVRVPVFAGEDFAMRLAAVSGLDLDSLSREDAVGYANTAHDAAPDHGYRTGPVDEMPPDGDAPRDHDHVDDAPADERPAERAAGAFTRRLFGGDAAHPEDGQGPEDSQNLAFGLDPEDEHDPDENALSEDMAAEQKRREAEAEAAFFAAAAKDRSGPARPVRAASDWQSTLSDLDAITLKGDRGRRQEDMASWAGPDTHDAAQEDDAFSQSGHHPQDEGRSLDESEDFDPEADWGGEGADAPSSTSDDWPELEDASTSPEEDGEEREDPMVRSVPFPEAFTPPPLTPAQGPEDPDIEAYSDEDGDVSHDVLEGSFEPVNEDGPLDEDAGDVRSDAVSLRDNEPEPVAVVPEPVAVVEDAPVEPASEDTVDHPSDPVTAAPMRPSAGGAGTVDPSDSDKTYQPVDRAMSNPSDFDSDRYPGLAAGAASSGRAADKRLKAPGNPSADGLSTGPGRSMPSHLAIRNRVQAARDLSLRALRDHVNVVQGGTRAIIQEFEEVLAELDEPDTEERVQARMELAPFGDSHFLERIMGESDLYPFSFLEKGHRTGTSVAKINAVGPDGTVLGYSSGFLVAPGLLLTNNHVLSDPAMVARSHAVFDYDLDEFGLPRPTRSFSLTGEIFLTSERFDYTILSVASVSREGMPLSDYGWIPLIRPSGKALKHERLSMIQHPMGDYKKIALRQSFVIGVRGAFIYYTTDTEQGSSGAPVLNDQWQVVALHHRSVPDPDHPGQYLANRGVRISAIFEDLERLKGENNAQASRILERLATRHDHDARSRRAGPGAGRAGAVLESPAASDPMSLYKALDTMTADRREAEGPETTRLEENPRVVSGPGAPRDYEWDDADWVLDHQNHPDTAHLPRAVDETFDLTAEVLEVIGRNNAFEPHFAPHGKILFALRGAVLADGSFSREDQSSLPIKVVRPNHQTFRCLIGIYDTGTKRLSAYRGSTVPNAGAVLGYYRFRNFQADRVMANLLPAGCYQMCVGTHAGRSRIVQGALRLGTGPTPDTASEVTVLRTENDVSYGTMDRWDPCVPKDNLHPAFGLNSFASQGCLTIRGYQNAPDGDATHQWAEFQAKAGIGPDKNGMRYDLVLVTGMEAAATAMALESGGNMKPLQCLRHGSRGDAVRRLQRAMGVRDSGSFDAATKFELTRLQNKKLTIATGTMTRDMQTRLGLSVFTD
ncbi:MAG: trypsin-like serine peptidase [Alphaproteobacteria bacterium]